jgi:integrase
MDLFRKYKNIEALLPGFLLEKETGIQTKSFYPYNWCSKVFIDWLKENHLANQPMRKITSDNVANFFYYLGRDKDLDRSTCEKYFLNLRQLFVYAKKRGELEVIPFDNIVYPRKKKDQGADVIQIDDLKILLPEIQKSDPQLYFACMIQYYCFIRPGKELRLLKISDIDLHNGLIVIRQENAKNKQRQTVTMPQQLIDICFDYGIDKADKTLFIFGNKKRFGTRVCSVNMLRWRFNKIRDRLNMSKGYKFYSFKHTGASRLHLAGVISMRELMDQLRHSKLEATQHYVHKHIGTVNNRIRDNFPSPI